MLPRLINGQGVHYGAGKHIIVLGINDVVDLLAVRPLQLYKPLLLIPVGRPSGPTS